MNERHDTIEQISDDLVRIQQNSDIMSQWPLPSVKIIYYLTPFIIPSLLKEINTWGKDPNKLFERKLLPGKLSNIIFFLTNVKTKERIGEKNHSYLLNKVLDSVLCFRQADKTWIPIGWVALNKTDGQNVKKTIFLLDNLAELVNPVFRTCGMDFFFDNDFVYRYYYNIGLEKEILIVSKKAGFEIDFFSHLIQCEDLSNSRLYEISSGEITEATDEKIFELAFNEIKRLRGNEIGLNEIAKNIFASLNLAYPKEMDSFLETPFPQEIIEWFSKASSLPKQELVKKILAVLTGE